MGAYTNLLSLGGVNLSDHGRKPLSEGRDERSVDVELANGSIRKYVKAVKRTWSIEWEWLPDESSATSDGYAGVNSLEAVIVGNGNSHQFVIKSVASGTTETYTVFVKAYNTNLIRRDMVGNVFYYNVSLELVQV